MGANDTVHCIVGGRMFMPLIKAPGLAFPLWLSLCWRKRSKISLTWHFLLFHDSACIT